MKTTLNIKDSLLADAKAKAFAAQQQTSLTRLIEEGCSFVFASRKPIPKKHNGRFAYTKDRAVWWPV